MTRLRTVLCGLGAVAILAAALPRLAPAEEVRMTLDQARALAQEAYRQGRPDVANRIGRQLVEADPDDSAALIVLAATEPLLGRPAEGRRAGRLAFAKAETDEDKYTAAYFASRAAFAEERYTAAQVWLRRAWHRAETDAQRDRVSDAFASVRRASPWRVEFAANVAPNSNVNGGSSSDFLIIDDDTTLPIGVLSGTAKALSGVTASVSGEISYALSRGERHRTTVTFRGYRTFNSLSDEAEEIAPDAKGSDFDYAVAELDLTHRVAAPIALLPDRVSLAFGRTWYGGEQVDRVLRATLSRSFSLGPGTVARLTGEVESRLSDREAEDRDGTELRFDLSQRLPGNHRLHLSVAALDVRSDDRNAEYTGASARLGLTLGREIAGIGISGHVGWSEKNYSDYTIGFFRIPGGREDETWTAGLDFTVSQVDWMGFTPTVSLNARQTLSNISRFEGDSLGLSVGFRSAF